MNQNPPTDEVDADTVAQRAAQVISSMGADIRALTAERDRYRTAWQSARFRAQAYGEGILRVVEDRESYQEWLKQEQAVTQQLRDLLGKENQRANAAIDREETAEQAALEAQQELAAARVQAIRDLADKADPQRPEISFFGDHGHEVGAWMRKQAEYAERASAAEETHVVADDSDDPEHVDDCPGCTAFTLTGHTAASAVAVAGGEQ